MVWALQGAGRQFAGLEEVKVRGVVRGLTFELKEIGKLAAEMAAGKIDSTRNFSLFRLENFLIYSPTKDKALLEKIQRVHTDCKQVNEALSSSRTKNKELIFTTTEKIPKATEDIIKELEGKAGIRGKKKTSDKIIKEFDD